MDIPKMLGALLVERSRRSPRVYKRIDRAVRRPRNPRYTSHPTDHGDIFSGPTGSAFREAMRRHGQPLHRWQTNGEPPFYAAPGYPTGLHAHANDHDECRDFEYRAELLLQAMIQATKADGYMDREEEGSIVNRLGRLSQEEVQFLQEEFERPVDVHGLALATPRGMEADVYAASLAAIRLDTTFEGEYLRDLAHCLRLSNRVVEQIHLQVGTPSPRWKRVKLCGS